MEKDNDDFPARPYQINLYEQAVKDNCIIYLPTGSGKTFIAVLLLKELSPAIQKPYSEGGQRTVFIVNTVPLTTQHTEYIKRHTTFSCNGYSGDMQVDFWKKEEWLKELEENQVLVMVAQIFLDVLNHGYISLERINLLIFDECHRAVSDHPMRQIMQRFETAQPGKQPRILALSATLLNSNVKLSQVIPTIESLKKTFHAKIATVSSTACIAVYSTNPQERSILYDAYKTPVIFASIDKILNDASEVLKLVKLRSAFDGNESSIEFKPKTKEDKLQSILRSIKEEFLTAGLFGGNKGTLLHLIQLEQLKKYMDDEATVLILQYLITALVQIRKIVENEMKDYPESEKIHRFSSNQVRTLFNILKDFNEKKLPEQKFCCIIFVKQRFTAKVLYHILLALRETDKEYNFLHPNFVLGFSNNPYKNSREVLCLSKWNKDVLHKFRNGTVNCVVATDVVDEGLDVPCCTLIVRYDNPMDFRAYVQSKGRARHKTSQYVMMISKSDTSFASKYKSFKDTEQYLQETLIEKTLHKVAPLEADIKDELYAYNVVPYRVVKDGVESVITEQSAISVINKYCALLYRSKFVCLTPTWKLYKRTTDKGQLYQVSLQLPNVSPLKDIVFGDLMSSIDGGKRSAALNTCIKLHKIGELTDNLLPSDMFAIEQNVDYLFPNWENETKTENQEEDAAPGTAAKKRLHELEYPKALHSAFPSPEKKLYLHVLHAKPTYSVPLDNRHLAFYNLLSNASGFGILSTKQMPQVPSFPIFMNVGELNVDVKVNYSTTTLSNDEIAKLFIFHTMVFDEIVKVLKSFMVFDQSNLENSFLVVPIDEKWQINWTVVDRYKTIEKIQPIVPFAFKQSDYELALVTPSYRVSSPYIVTKICEGVTPNSSFPTEDFYSYTHYYKEKYRLDISAMEQPMLEVKQISTKINCTRPRSMKPGLSKRKRADVLEDFEEHLVPEFCVKIDFPALYWLKATTLPSVLHRISQLLIADDLRTTIVMEAGLGVLSLPPGNTWPPLIVAQSESEESMGPPLDVLCDDTIENTQPGPRLNGPEVDVLDLEETLYPWTKDQEPSDLERDADKIQLIDIEYYCHFMSASSDIEKQILKSKNKTVSYMDKLDVVVPSLNILKTHDPNGPDPVHIAQALTTKMGCDVFDLERLETLGDSYLKFFISLFLHHSFSTYNEGRLTSLKGKIIGNRNLYYCGNKKSIPGRLKVDDFVPLGTFIAPAYSAYRPLQSLLLEQQISPNVLYEIRIPTQERLTGCISEGTLSDIQERVLNWEPALTHTGMEPFLGVQTVADKVVADSVEALIGVYLKTMGVQGAAKLLRWFGILPEKTDVNKILTCIASDPKIGSGDPHKFLVFANAIEKRVGYKFKNQLYLLQAFTHPSYSANTITECYQRLEFLGDAILDFLITCYIYEYCGDLSPGDLTDLRSALVNNITFACLAVKYGLHTALLSYAPKLNDIIDRFVKFQEERNYAVDDELLTVLLEEDECNMSEYVDVPKVLGDIFESLIGAIYLDSGKDLFKVWEVIYRLMAVEIDEFSANVPKQPVRVIYETQGANPRFMKATKIEDTCTVMVPLEITVAGKQKLFHGFGGNKKQAKCAAAKQALKFLRCKK